MKFDTDMTGIDEGRDFQLLPPGMYTCEVVNVEDGYSKAGDPMIKVTLEVAYGEYAGRLVFDRILFPKVGSPAEKILGRSKHFLHVIGEPYEDKFEVDSDNWVGKKCGVLVMHREYEGKMYANVRGYDFFEPADQLDERTDSEAVPF